ncbi:hypothetical protein FQN60_007830 [Etheostoma spectabile]|uniref:Uncharacterized protein n=1 Tax=Etheostoma spectabile TaxID=54343 RepID=A0A5J5D3Y3_9PERO|nr:hypothetical protein FQN60_007830 [Etheostoma spectabile]
MARASKKDMAGSYSCSRHVSLVLHAYDILSMRIMFAHLHSPSENYEEVRPEEQAA